MKQVLHIFLCFMISFGLAREDILLQEDGTPASQKESRQYDQPSKKADKYDQVILNFPAKYPFIDSKCCNLSTTSRCSSLGTEGFKGHCMPRNETCLGREYFGTRYCIISKHQSCKCCIPTDCPRNTLSPCAKLNGTCIGLRDQCNGTSVLSEEFCRSDSKTDSCKCCIPLVTKVDCPCGQNHDGICLGRYPRDHVSDGKQAKGRCMKTCDTGHISLIDNTCNTTGGEECKCCDIYDYCGRSCESPNQTSCMCMINGNSCPKGYCSHADTDMCPEGSCACCRDKPTECRSKLEQCSAPNDYCVDKVKGDCPEGYSKVHDACITPLSDGEYENKDCDCCKSLECSSIEDRCTGREDFCVDFSSACPKGYAESLDCSKPIIVNGTVIGKRKCKCCKPITFECPKKDCFQIGSQCFRRISTDPISWHKALQICGELGETLAEPNDPQALTQYLANNYGAARYWIGGGGTSNGNTIWLSGGVVGPDAPWIGNWYTNCMSPSYCMTLSAHSICYSQKYCFACLLCNANVLKEALCTCNNS